MFKSYYLFFAEFFSKGLYPLVDCGLSLNCYVPVQLKVGEAKCWGVLRRDAPLISC